jgi:hypothetical protein
MNWRVIILSVVLIGIPIIVLLFGFVDAAGGGLSGLLLGIFGLLSMIIICLLPDIIVQRFVKKRWRNKSQEFWEDDFKAYEANLFAKISSCHVLCNICNAPAKPVLNSNNGYRCSKCDNQFVGEEHGLIDEKEWIRRNPDPWDQDYPLSI